MSKAKWQKSSFSGDRDECVEAAGLDGKILIRESDDPEAVVTTTPARWRTFICDVKSGEFDHLI
ncbi:DUF397 domain-containing protein [Streptomyces albireticuli]|uniref:DUF397 domain-containing protein n=2 Tax=Streptomyces albireticuli TaxID=1940 RepID=A0A2A2CZW3_9ACTN|nr:DUF397 domain-containing protein [Streptomyces albireticuli]MCD9143628.1 DUF397 domain-containing protein [Streptomyces albireticuli]MCD9161941.1 DUF397 domain-containing protein [Streptomyces albireticuli]MCD9191745.1 DUF397 domain-containing protein [Streptomyces albireticuli]PAU44747.1 DUF397 domain-containing protein [Streptomyces albireticuli]